MAVEMLIFDLDGVLFDSTNLIIEAVTNTVTDFAYEEDMDLFPPSRDHILSLMGRPNSTWVEGLGFNLTESQWKKFKKMIVEEEVRLIEAGQGRLYDGILPLLEWLSQRSTPCAIASNCGRRYLVAFLDHFRLHDYFDLSVCNDDAPFGDKSDLLAMVLENQEILPAEAVYLGDREFDETAAHRAGTGFVACLWGFGRSESFSEAAVRCDNVRELKDILQKLLNIGYH